MTHKIKPSPCQRTSPPYLSDLISCQPLPSSLFPGHTQPSCFLPTLEACLNPRTLALIISSTCSALPPDIYMAPSSKLLLKYHFTKESFLILNVQFYLTIRAFLMPCLIFPHNIYCFLIYITFTYIYFLLSCSKL